MKIEKAYYWPYWFTSSCPETKKQLKSKKFSQLYGQGQIYLWRALNIYDDFLDGSGKAIELPRANDYFRRFLKILYQSKLSPETLKNFEAVIIDLEKCNQEEVRQSTLRKTKRGWKVPTRIPDFSNLTRLSRKSLTLAIMPICCCIKINPGLNLAQQEKQLEFFRIALAAKQLADDAADWMEDLLAGKITPATSLIIKATQKQKIKLNLENNPTQLHPIFISSAGQQLAHNILILCHLARQQAIKCGISSTAPILQELLRPLEKNANCSLDCYQDKRMGKKMIGQTEGWVKK